MCILFIEEWNDFTEQVQQGYEDEIFKGLSNLLDRYSIDNILVEILPRRDLEYKLRFIADLMQEGYHVYTYNDRQATNEFISNEYGEIIPNAQNKF